MFDLTLTFDNGPEPAVTPVVLDVLAHHGVLSTFFVIGSKLADPKARACAERAHAEGHWIGNHTFSHGIPPRPFQTSRCSHPPARRSAHPQQA